MKRLFILSAIVLSSLQVFAYKSTELFTMSDRSLEMLAWDVEAVSGLEGIGTCNRFLHRVKISELGADENVNIVFQEYLESLKNTGEEVDFIFIRYLEKSLDVIQSTMRSMAPRDASAELVNQIDAFSEHLANSVQGREWLYSGGLIHYVDPVKQTETRLINVRVLQDPARNEFLIWGNGRCTNLKH
jgi:hypothetical protein